MNKAAADLIRELLEIIKGTKNFAIEQAPDVFKQIISYGIIFNAVYLVIGISLLVCAFFSGRKMLSNIKQISYSKDTIKEEALVFLFGFICFFSFLFGAIISVDHLNPFIKATTAPKVYMIDYLMDLK